jgi:hypothetical protein
MHREDPMTDKQIAKAAAERGFKNTKAKTQFAEGHRAAVDGMERDERQSPAWLAGYDYTEEPTPLGERTITVDEREFTVVLQKARGRGFEALIPIQGGTATVFGETDQIALGAACDRIAAAAHEFAERGQVRSVDQRTIAVDGKDHVVHVTTFTSGAVDIVADGWDDVKASAADEEAGLASIAALIGAKLAETVDGQPATIVRDPRPQEQQLPRTSAECAAEVHRCMDALRERESEEETAKNRRKAAETALSSAYRALLDATDREAAEKAAAPELPLGSAA